MFPGTAIPTQLGGSSGPGSAELLAERHDPLALAPRVVAACPGRGCQMTLRSGRAPWLARECSSERDRKRWQVTGVVASQTIEITLRATMVQKQGQKTVKTQQLTFELVKKQGKPARELHFQMLILRLSHHFPIGHHSQAHG